MDVTITPAPLAGRITPPPSKSQAHRAVLAMMLSQGVGDLRNLSQSQDIEATKRCCAALKDPGAPCDGLPMLDCGESGSTLRFLIPVALALRGGGHFTGQGRLMDRPQKPYFDIFDEKGIFYDQLYGVLTVKGTLLPGIYRLPGDVSSQFVTGLLYALPLLDGDSEIVLTSPLESRDYVAMTLDVLERFGVKVENEGYERFQVPGKQRFTAVDMTIEADWSQAGFWYAAAFLGNAVEVAGMDPNSAQGDRVVAELYWRLAKPGDVAIDVSGCPDLVPPLAVMAAVRQGEMRIVNAARLRIKESDRLSAVTQVLRALGADIAELPDGLRIAGQDRLKGGAAVDSFNDHRIAMMAAVAATVCAAPVTVLGAECVRKSYPGFWDDYKALGGQLEVRE
ncbi:MAG: 3-phosphoshikimate 1-carboxyvinyltransferase [Oscillospiraceae bacterium]|jgi:3-phosphoshikimate 1-carboxyvinyltransferase|nr:3-phosphoshikimate 1-carboxyvinyltransferase [Oscillospiraceae bacterium]